MTNTHTNTQIQIQERKGQSAEKAIHVAYFRNSESARISNMMFSVHHQTITQRQIQKQIQRQRKDKDKVKKRLYMWHIFEKQRVQGYQI